MFLDSYVNQRKAIKVFGLVLSVTSRIIKITLSFSIIGNEEQISSYELHIAVKDYCFGRDNRLIGVSVMQLKDIQDQVRTLTLTLSSANDLISGGTE